jgi:microcystin-dependent protein
MPWTDISSFAPGAVLTADQMNDLRDNANIGHTVCTSATRPAGPDTGRMIYETDTAKLLIWNGSAWVDVYPAQPTGSLTAYAGAAAPTGWLLCDGTAVSRTTYATLFGLLSTTYGAGNGSTTFNLPDMRGRMPMGAGTGAGQGASGSGAPSGTALTARTRGGFGGDERMQTHTHVQNAHTHTQNAHGHDLGGGQSFGTSFGPNAGGVATFGLSVAIINTNTYQGPYSAMANTATNQNTTATNQNAGSGASENMPPFVVLNYIIKT